LTARAVTLVATAVLLGAAGAAAGYYLNRSPAAAAGEAHRFTVTAGETLGTVADRLHRARLIRSPLLLRAVAKARGTESAVKPGDFRIPADATTMEIHELLVGAATHLLRLTVPEGWTLSRIGAHLEQSGVTGADEFAAAARSEELLREYGIEAPSAEGYLFPDTYLFPPGYAAEQVARHMIDTFFVRLEEIYPAHGALDPGELHRKVIMASMVEREYRVPDEAPVIASVFYNRLGANFRLQSCATIVYVITELQGREHPSRILHADLEIESGFNTYRTRGLPPGPIANPGITALRAALFPADTEYWYFVVKDPATGAHHFSYDPDEHSEAKFLYLKGAGAAAATHS
jgi:UPF0755 protein